MIDTQNQQQHELMKEIMRLTMLLKAKHPAKYEHLDETPVLKSSDDLTELKSLQDYKSTLEAQLKEGEAKDAELK